MQNCGFQKTGPALPKNPSHAPSPPIQVKSLSHLFLTASHLSIYPKISAETLVRAQLLPALPPVLGMDDDGKDLERVDLIDVFSEDDVLVSYPLGSSPLVCGSPLEYRTKCRMQGDQGPVPTDSPELAHSTTCKYNLRKSLAWDSAFFTSEGVLDPEELADVNSTFKNVQTCMLPGIQEDSRKSVDSHSTLDSDTRVVESAELDLFEHLEASVQRSQGKQGKDRSSIRISSTFSSGKRDVADSGRKIHDFANSAFRNDQDKMKATSENRQKKPSPRMTRSASRLPVEPIRRTPSSRSVQPKTMDKVLLASSHVGKGQHLNAKEKLVSGDLNNLTSRVTTSVKVSDSSVKPHAIASFSSNLISGGTSCDRMGKARPEDLRKKTSRKVDQPSSKSVNVCLLRDSKGNCGVKNAKSTVILSSSSSVDSLASESSSSSTSTVKNPTNSPTALDPSSYGTNHDSGRVPKGEWLDIGSSGIHLWSNLSTVDAARHHISGSEAKGFKPSGLRMPSPKVGHFDTEKHRPHISNRYSLQITKVSTTLKTSLKNDDGQLNKGLIIPNL